jgi:hypothetical protein
VTDRARGTLVELDGYGFVRIPWGSPPDEVDETAVHGLPVTFAAPGDAGPGSEGCPIYQLDERRKVWLKV